jgi:alpha-tubulin suppressor-like RCC1 family protein
MGQLADGTGGSSFVPSAVVNVEEGVAAVDAGPNRSCFLTTTGGVKCSGLNHFGQLGHDRIDVCFFFPCSLVPEYVQTLESGASAVASGPGGGIGGGHSCALTTAGGVKCWGLNSGALGDGGACGQVCMTPIDVPGLEGGVTAVTAGDGPTCAITAGGGVKCWGANILGLPGCCDTPTNVPGLESGVAAVATGAFHACALTEAGGVKCWGLNNAGQLGDGDACSEYCPPADVVGLESGVATVTAGAFFTCAQTTAGALKCWGDNTFGELGTGASDGETHALPLDIPELETAVSAVDGGTFHVCALMADGGVKCWGANDYGQLGDGQECFSLSGCPRPVDVVGLGPKPTATETAETALSTATPTDAVSPTISPTSRGGSAPTSPTISALPVTGTVVTAGESGPVVWIAAALLTAAGISIVAWSTMRLGRRAEP